MKLRYLTTVLIISLFTAGCQSGERAETEKLEAAVMAVHDEVMPRIEEVMDLKSKVSERLSSIDSLAQKGPLTADMQTRRQNGLVVSQALLEADSLMSAWMSTYNGDSLKGLDANGATAYLESEMKKITIVKDKINGSIEQARQYLQTQP